MISFNCPQCSQKFSAPPAAAGKQVTCSGCGSKVTVPTPGAALPPQSFQPPAPGPVAAPSPGPAAVFHPPQASTSSGYAGGFTAPGRNRRAFPALRFVAGVLVFLSVLYIIGGILGGVGAIGAAGPDGMPGSLFLGIGIVLLALLAAAFIRAGAEMIRLALYLAELLEDIRDK
jgi:DNA-directed RNA polymerase subunit RPC12/RpoP